MTFETARFGNVDVEDTAVMTMTEGLYGFPHLHRFVVIPVSYTHLTLPTILRV